MAGAMWWLFITTDKVSVVTIMDNRVKALIRIVLTCADIWYQLVDHGVPSSEIEGQSTKFVLNLCKWESSMSSEYKSNWNHQNRDS